MLDGALDPCSHGRGAVPCGPDVARHFDAIESRAHAGYDEIYVQQIGPDMDGFFSTYAREILPKLRRRRAA